MLTSCPMDCADHPVKTPPHLNLAGVVGHGDFYQAHLMAAKHGSDCLWVDFFHEI